MTPWKEYKLGELISVKHGYAFPGEHITSKDNSIVLVTPGNFNIGGGFKEDKCKFFDGQIPDDFILKSGDLIVTMTDLSRDIDTLGYSAVVPTNDRRIYLHNQRIGLIKFKTNDISPMFLNYLMRSHEYQKWIANTSSGTTVHHTSPSKIENYTTKIPSLSIQKKIAAILSSLDDKIETNRAINARLEELAAAIFKSWFIDFEPFAGSLPPSWEVKPLSHIAKYVNGLAMQKYPALSDSDKLPVLKIKELGQGYCSNDGDFCSKNSIGEQFIINDGDVIFSWSGTLMVKIWTGGQCGLNQHLFKVVSDEYPKWFIYLWTKYHNDKFIRIAKDKAVTMGHIKREELDKALAIIPPDDIFEKIDSILAPIIDEYINRSLEISRLSALRDTLLPRLMSGALIPQ